MFTKTFIRWTTAILLMATTASAQFWYGVELLPRASKPLRSFEDRPAVPHTGFGIKVKSRDPFV